MPKKTKIIRNNNYSYDPETQRGFEILNNIDELNRVGAAIQQHNRDISGQIDSELARRNRRNAEEENWERRKRQIHSDAEQVRNPTFVFGAGQMNQISLAGAKQQNLIEDAVRHGDLPNQPEDYGFSDFLKDRWNSFFGELNNLQAQDARGLQTRAKVDKYLIDKYLRSLDSLDEIDEIDFRLNQIRQISRKNLTRGQLETLNNEVEQLTSRKAQLKQEYDELGKYRKQLEDTVNQSEIGKMYDDFVSGSGYWGESIFGKTTALHDEINDARRFLYDLGKGNKSRTDTRRMINRALKEYDSLDKEWQEIAEENEKDSAKHKDKVSAWFKGLEQKTDINLTDPDTYLFKMPGILGGSASSYMKQLPGLAASLIANVAAAATGGIGAIPLIAAGSLTNFAFNKGAGRSENNAEVALAIKEKIQQRTGMSDKDVDDILSGKLTDQKKLRQFAESALNSENLFQADMAATTWDAAIDAALQTVPIGFLAKGGGLLRGRKALRFIAKHPTLKNIVRSKFGQQALGDFKQGYQAVDVVGPVGGALGGALNATVGRAAKNLGNVVVRKAGDSFYGALAKKMGAELKMLGEAAVRVDPVEVAMKKGLMSGTRSKYLRGIGGRMIKSAISEGIEEGKQYQNAEAFKNDTLKNEIMGAFDIGLTDMVNGLKTGAYVLGIPLDSLGLVDLKDKQMLQEIKGGMIGGWGHTALVTTLQSAVPYVRQQAANELILEHLFKEKLQSQANFKQYTNWLQKGLFSPKQSDVLDSINRLRKLNDDYKQINFEDGVSEEAINKAESDYLDLLSIAKNPLTKMRARAMGIEVPDWKKPSVLSKNKEYYEFVAAQKIAKDKITEDSENAIEAMNDRISTEQKVRQSLSNNYDYTETRQQLSDITRRQLANGVSELEGQADVDSVLDSVRGEQDAEFQQTSILARLAALLKYRRQIELGLEAQKNNSDKRVRRGLKKQLEKINKDIKLLSETEEDLLSSSYLDLGNDVGFYQNSGKKVVTLEDVESLVWNQEAHEQLRDAYEEEIKWKYELESSREAYDAVFGKLQRIDEDGKARDLDQEKDKDWVPQKDLKHVTFTKGEARRVIDDIHKMEDDDDDFESVIEQVYKEDLKAEHLKDENGLNQPQVAPMNVRPVLDGNGNQITVQYSKRKVDDDPEAEEQIFINRKLADGEFVDSLGRLWEHVDDDRKDPFEEAQKVRPTNEDFDEDVRQAFRDTWAEKTGSPMPFTPQAFWEQQALERWKRQIEGDDDTPPKKRYVKPVTTWKVKPVAPDPTSQQSTLDALDKKYKEDKDTVLMTTSQDYFILVDDKVIRMSRVHNVKPESYEHPDQNKQIEDIYREISNSETVAQLRKKLERYDVADLNSHLAYFFDVTYYCAYLEANEVVFFNNPTPENAKELDTIFRNIARSIVNATRGISSSIRMGNVADELNRNFFGTPNLYNLTSTKDGIKQLFNTKNESEGKTYAELFSNNFEQFESYIKQLRDAYEYYTKTLGWELRTLPLVWRAKFNSTGWVAGETDMIGVDKAGRIHIIDFKTSRDTFGEKYVANMQLTSQYQSDLNVIHKEDFKNGKPNKKVRTILKNIKQDSKGNKNIVIQWDDNIGRAVIMTKIRPFVNKPNASYGQVISAYDDYSNQQTAYAELINIEMPGELVASIEILPTKCVYDTSEFRVVNSMQLEPRIPLMLSSKMRDILTGVVDRNAETVQHLRDQINSLLVELANKKVEFANKVSDEMFETLSENGKLAHSDFITAINNIRYVYSDDIDYLQSIIDQINEVLDKYQSTLDEVIQDYQRQKDFEARRAEEQAKRDKRDAHIQPEVEQPITLVNAENKNDSAGNTSHTNLNYIQVGSDRTLELATSSPDFITSAEFVVYSDGNELYADITYKRNTWKRIKIDTSYNGTQFPQGTRLLHQVKELERTKKPGQRIVAMRSTMNRTRGRIKLAVNDKNQLVYVSVNNTDLFAGEDIYDIEFSPAYGKIGIIDNSGQAVTFDAADTQRKPIFSWKNPKHIPAKGTIIYVKHVRKDELDKDSLIPVGIDRVKMTDEDAQFILQFLDQPLSLDKEYFVEINGKAYNTYATGRQLINLMIPVIDNPSDLGTAVSILRDQTNQNIVRIMTRDNLASMTNGRGVFDISIPQQRQAFIDTIKSLSIGERHDVLLTRLGTDTNPLLPFQGVRKFFSTNEEINNLSITGTLKFDVNDFKRTTSAKGVVRSGLNGLAYYLSNNMLITQYAGMGSCNVEIKDVTLEDDNMPPTQSNGVNPFIPNTIESPSEEAVDRSEIEAFLLKTGTKPRKRLSREKALRHIREILGDDVPVEIEDDFLKVTSGAACVVGLCKADAIKLSTLGWNGVEYHEAFHRVFETLIPEKERDEIYQRIADRLGLKLYKEDGSEDELSFRIVAEYAADKYMEHMNWRWKDIKIPFITKAYNKIHDWVWTLFNIKDKDLYKIFIRLNRGEYKNAMPSQKAVERFNRLYSELYAQIHGVDFKYIVNRPMYDKLKQTVVMCIMQGQNVDPSGRNIQEIGKHIDKQTFQAGITKLTKLGYDITGVEAEIPTVGQLAMQEIYNNFDNEQLRDDIANSISVIATDFIKIRELDSIDAAQSDDVTNADIGEHTRSSYEFSRFEKTSSRVRFFFATIPDTYYEEVDTVDSTGKPIKKKVTRMSLNEFGLPQFIPVNTVFNEFLNLFHDVDTVDELLTRLQEYGKEDPLYDFLYQKINKIRESTYTVDGTKLVVNADQEALLSQLMNIIRSNKHSFDIARSKSLDNECGFYDIIIQTTDADYNAKFYPTQWNQMLVNGGTQIIKMSPTGKLEFNKYLRGSETVFDRIADAFSHSPSYRRAENGSVYTDVGIAQWLNNAIVENPIEGFYLKLKVNGQYRYFNNPNDKEQLEVVKDKIVEMLNLLGIGFGTDELNYMLRHKYGSTDASALARMFNSRSRNDSMTSFLTFLRDVGRGGTLKQELRIGGKKRNISAVYEKMAFVRELANWKYQYRHSHDQLTVLATNNNKFYEISDNNYVSDVLRFLNKRSKEFDEIKSDVYNYYKDHNSATRLGYTPAYGSLILDELSENPDAVIEARNFVGFKTDKRSDDGSDYFQISKREDYVSKATILQQGGIIMPTLSDKKTWMYLYGIKLPGLDYSNTVDDDGNVVPFSTIGDQFVIPADGISQYENMLTQDKAVIDQFISYALSEYASVKKADADLDQMERDGTKSSEVANYYTKEQGAKFSSLIGVWEYDYKKDQNGQMVIVGETFHSFNDGKKSRKENIREAETYFFSRTREEQEALISRLLHKRLLKEINTCVKLGLIEKTGDSDNLFQNYKNIGLSAKAIQAIYKSLIVKNGEPVDVITQNKYKSLATIIYINDISNKAIMSGQEIERVFSGNPAYYKWVYDKEGNLIDRTVDELKRLGGLASTGNNNFMELKGSIPEKYLDANGNFTGNYVAAQVENELIESPQISVIGEMMTRGEIATAAYLQREAKEINELRERFNRIRNIMQSDNSEQIAELSEEDRDFYEEHVDGIWEEEKRIRREISKQIDATPTEELEKSLDETTRKIALRKAKEATDSYRLKYKEDGSIDDGIDVADGAAYVTDVMAEMLLRMNGNYSSEIQEAFRILREEKPATILEKQSAYQKVLTSVIGTQKYTAFGRRTHSRTGTQVAYYNKMALFPIFKCIATGKLANIFSKMQQQGIDMLMVDSAVKLGGQGSKAVVWDNFMRSSDESDPVNHIDNDINNPLKPSFDEGFQFSTYEQKFLYLRKQLNTDPKEESFMNMGTQMTKIVMAAMFDGREYRLQDGSVLDGDSLREDIMDAIKTLSDRGYAKEVRKFFKTNDKGNLVNRDGVEIDDHSQEKVLDEVKFSKEIRKLLSSKDPDKNILAALELVDRKDPDGVVRKHMRLPLNAISNSKWLESVLVSDVNKKVIDIETTGAAFIQRSVWAMEGGTMFERGKGNIISDEDLPHTLNNGERLKMINEEGSMDCVLSIDFFKKMFKGEMPMVPIKDKNHNVIWDKIPEKNADGSVKKDENGNVVYAVRKDKDGKPMTDENGNPVYKRKIRTREMTFDEMRKWLINRGIIGPNAKANIIGYRIPTQAGSSIHALRCVDVLPVVNDTVILPAEFTKITGSDFKYIEVIKFL